MNKYFLLLSMLMSVFLIEGCQTNSVRLTASDANEQGCNPSSALK